MLDMGLLIIRNTTYEARSSPRRPQLAKGRECLQVIIQCSAHIRSKVLWKSKPSLDPLDSAEKSPRGSRSFVAGHRRRFMTLPCSRTSGSCKKRINSTTC